MRLLLSIATVIVSFALGLYMYNVVDGPKDDVVYDVGTGSGQQPAEAFQTRECDGCSAEEDETVSYLGRPRLHFVGMYRADVSTVNNYFYNYNLSNFSLVNQLVKKPNYGDFNPDGSGSFSFQDCFVTSVCPNDPGKRCTTDDILVGKPLESTTGHTTGKMSRVDVELEHMTPLIYGMTIGLDVRGTSPFIGRMDAAPSKNVWHNVWDVGRGPDTDQFSQGSYQSVLVNVSWNKLSPLLDHAGGSKILLSLKRKLDITPHSVLSIKFNLDHYQQNDESNPHFLYGRVTGTIGPASLDDPKFFIRDRVLQFDRKRGVPVNSHGKRPTNVAPFKVNPEARLVVFDFGNALSRSSFNGGWNTDQLGNVLTIRTRSSKYVIGSLLLTSNECLTKSAGVCEFHLERQEDLDVIRKEYVDVYNESNDLLLREVDYYVRPIDPYVQKLDAGDHWTVNFFVNNLGYKICGYVVKVEVHLASKHTPADKRKRALKALQIKNGEEVEGSNAKRFVSDCRGKFTVEFETADPGNPRGIIDGEVYQVSYVPEIDNQCFTYLYARVFDHFNVTAVPHWHGKHGVEKILKEYDNLYPVMRKFVVLSDFFSVTKPWNVHFLNLSMTLNEWQPGYMPVTRDLSRAKRQTVLNWLNSKQIVGKKAAMDLAELKKNLQTAIEVEHASIPLYLYALYSIKPGSNVEAYNLIRSVVIEEMVHMTLAANILNAIGGDPDIVHDKFIPIFPGPMPGGLHPELTLRLEPLSKNLLQNVFMVFEQPRESPINDDPETHHLTLGSFYREIEKALVDLDEKTGGKIFISDHSRQVTGAFLPNETAVMVFPVTDLKSARKAIRMIVREGEGSNQVDPNDGYGELAHFYKFSEIYYGRKLVRDGKDWSYTGDLVTLDEHGIYPLVDNPRLEDYPVGSRARLLSSDFSTSYLNLLGHLNAVFLGEPERIAETFGAMNYMNVKASKITVLPVVVGDKVKNAGPTFLNPLLMPSP